MTNLFIPEKIKVGYQERQDTYTGKLAYVIYYDEKGKLRKEVSWQGWRSKDITPDDFSNEPTEGFVLNKEVQRYNWSHFGSNRSYIRIYDPRGIEFEITPDNLIGLLMECDCNKRMLEGKFVYAWHGKELILLPCSSEGYKQAVEHTKRQSKKVSARNLVVGCSYTLKNGNELIYMGRFTWYKWTPRTRDPHGRTMKKYHVFWDGNDFKHFNSMTKLSFLNSPEPVQEYAELMDKLQSDIRVQQIVGWYTEPAAPTKIILEEKYGHQKIKNDKHFKLLNNIIEQYKIEMYNYYDEEKLKTSFSTECEYRLDIETLKVTESSSRYSYYEKAQQKSLEKNTLDQLKDCVNVYAILESGKKYKITRVNTWDMPGQY